jgi:hypothetical protein
VPVGDRLVDQGPQPLGRLQLRAIRRQERQCDPVRDGQVLGAVPAGVVQHEHDVALAAGAGLLGEAGKQGLEQGLGQAGGPAQILRISLRNHTASPLVGWTNAVTCSHW